MHRWYIHGFIHTTGTTTTSTTAGTTVRWDHAGCPPPPLMLTVRDASRPIAQPTSPEAPRRSVLRTAFIYVVSKDTTIGPLPKGPSNPYSPPFQLGVDESQPAGQGAPIRPPLTLVVPPSIARPMWEGVCSYENASGQFQVTARATQPVPQF